MHSLGHTVWEGCWLSPGSLGTTKPSSFLPRPLPVAEEAMQGCAQATNAVSGCQEATRTPLSPWLWEGGLCLSVDVRHTDMYDLAFGQRVCMTPEQRFLNSRSPKWDDGDDEVISNPFFFLFFFWEIWWSNFYHIDNEPASYCKVLLWISNLHQKQYRCAKIFIKKMKRKLELMLCDISSYLFTTGPFSYYGWV